MKRIRQLHLYLGLLFAPSILFFALTGALQTFGLHESRDPATQHPAWIAKLAEIHKNQRLASPPRPKPAGEIASSTKPAEPQKRPEQGEEAPRGPSPLPLKIYVLFMSIGLMTTTLLGVYMAFKYNRDRKIIWGLLIAGTLLPIALLFL